MPPQLISIHTVQAKATAHTTNGSFVRVGGYTSNQPKLNIQRQKGTGTVQIERTQEAHLELNVRDVLDSVSPNKISTVSKQIFDRGKADAQAATEKYAREGSNFADPNVNAVQQIAQAVIMEDGNKNWGLDWVPKVQSHAEYTPSRLSMHYEPDRLSITHSRGTPEYEYRPGGTETSLEVPGSAKTTYTGGFNFFPSGRHIDRYA